jgi:hypothetical protein
MLQTTRKHSISSHRNFRPLESWIIGLASTICHCANLMRVIPKHEFRLIIDDTLNRISFASTSREKANRNIKLLIVRYLDLQCTEGEGASRRRGRGSKSKVFTQSCKNVIFEQKEFSERKRLDLRTTRVLYPSDLPVTGGPQSPS